MDQIEFICECHVDGQKFESGSVVDESSLPAEWVTGAVREKFVKRVKTPVVEAPADKAPAGDAVTTTAAKSAIPAEVQAALDAAVGK